MSEKYLLDSDVWLSYFYGQNKAVIDYIESELILLSSSISMFEVKRKLKKDKISSEKIAKVISFISKRSIVIDATQEICESASNINLGDVDSIIYTTAMQNNAILLTNDSVYKKIKNTILLN